MNDHARYAVFLGMMGMLAVIAVALLSFVGFVDTLETNEPDDPPASQGIVVLTGGADRLADGLRLLDIGKGARLLVSGVHPATTLTELKRLMPERNVLLTCCVDLDHAAGNTRGNARETARWAKRNGFSRLIIVTASYHVPRATLEFSRQMPGVALAYYPVVPDLVGLRTWWREPNLLRILMFEYAKFRFAQLRIRLGFGTPVETGG
jgi:uncharacterized SAM-binding protein YcdF (DUF218 family)